MGTLIQEGCSNVRCQGIASFRESFKNQKGRSYQTAIIWVEVADSGACEETLWGIRQAFSSRANNTGEKPFNKHGLI